MANQDNPFADLIPKQNNLSEDNPFHDLVPEKKASEAGNSPIEGQSQGPGAFMSGVMGFNRAIERGVEGVTGLFMPEATKRIHDTKEAQFQAAKEAHPIAGRVGEATGYLSEGLILPSATVGRGVMSAIASGAITGGAFGAAQYADTLQERGKAGLIGAGLGGTFGALGEGIGRIIQGRRAVKLIPQKLTDTVNKIVPDDQAAAETSKMIYRDINPQSISEDSFSKLMSNKSISSRLQAIEKNPDLASAAYAPNTVGRLNAVKRQLDDELYTGSSFFSGARKMSKDEREGITAARDLVRETLKAEVPGYADVLANDSARIIKSKLNETLEKATLQGEKEPSIPSLYTKFFNTKEKQTKFISAVERSGGDPDEAKNLITAFGKAKVSGKGSHEDLLGSVIGSGEGGVIGGTGGYLLGRAYKTLKGPMSLGGEESVKAIVPELGSALSQGTGSLAKALVSPAVGAANLATGEGFNGVEFP